MRSYDRNNLQVGLDAGELRLLGYFYFWWLVSEGKTRNIGMCLLRPPWMYYQIFTPGVRPLGIESKKKTVG